MLGQLQCLIQSQMLRWTSRSAYYLWFGCSRAAVNCWGPQPNTKRKNLQLLCPSLSTLLQERQQELRSSVLCSIRSNKTGVAGWTPPIFDRDNSYWKIRIEAYLEALDGGVLRAAAQGFTAPGDPANLHGDKVHYEKWNAKARNTLFRGLCKDVFNRMWNHKDAHSLW